MLEPPCPRQPDTDHPPSTPPLLIPQYYRFSHDQNLSYRGQPGPYNQKGRWLTQEYTWSVGLSTLVISTIPGFSLSILAQCLPVSLALSVDDSCKHLGA